MKPPRSRMLAAHERIRTVRWFPAVSVMIGSLVTAVPVIAPVPVLPPLGLLILLGWRLRRPELFTIWAPVPLGLFDDLVSGQPLGSAMLLWVLCFFAIDVIDRRLVWRDFWQDWLIAAGAAAGCLIGGRFVAVRIDAHVDTVLLLQVVTSALCFPVIAVLVARLDRMRRT